MGTSHMPANFQQYTVEGFLRYVAIRTRPGHKLLQLQLDVINFAHSRSDAAYRPLLS